MVWGLRVLGFWLRTELKVALDGMSTDAALKQQLNLQRVAGTLDKPDF